MSINLSFSDYNEHLYEVKLYAQKHQFKYSSSTSWSTDEKKIFHKLPESLKQIENNSGLLFADIAHFSREQFIMAVDDAIYYVSLGDTLNLTICAKSNSKIREIYTSFLKLAPKKIASSEQEIDVAFWFHGPHGPTSQTRRIPVPTWKEVAPNYNSDVVNKLNILNEIDKSSLGAGKLFLFYGPPGGGKTYTIRSLGWEWKNWCDYLYITDPEIFFGTPSYMLGVLLDTPAFEPVTNKWKLLILEDCGELISSDAKERAGQGLSRLLNLVDGLIGQGLNILVLITTNEDIGRLHPAIVRPGRCLAKINFGKLSIDESNFWLETHGSDKRVQDDTSLAELYAILQGDGPISVDPQEKVIGFTTK